MMTIHEERAMEIGQDQQQRQGACAACSQTGARQGDLILRPTPGAPQRGDDTGPAGRMIAAGRHGEHRMIAPSLLIEGDAVHLAEGGLLVHTDLPTCRHRAVQFPPGVWRLTIERELRGGEVVNVQD